MWTSSSHDTQKCWCPHGTHTIRSSRGATSHTSQQLAATTAGSAPLSANWTTWLVSSLSRLNFFNGKVKGKGFPYLLPNVGPGADPDVQAVSPQMTISDPPGGRLPLLFARTAVIFPAAQHHHPLADTKLYCLVTEAHRCEQLAQGCYAALARVGFEPTTCWSQVQRSTRCATMPHDTTGTSRKKAQYFVRLFLLCLTYLQSCMPIQFTKWK